MLGKMLLEVLAAPRLPSGFAFEDLMAKGEGEVVGDAVGNEAPNGSNAEMVAIYFHRNRGSVE
jgi:hypothetical protein